MDFIRRLKRAVVVAEGRWFDTTRGVQTEGFTTLGGLTLVGAAKQGYEYLPVRPENVRAAFKHLPVRNPGEFAFSRFAFVDLGSGKGRMLFLAAEYPFRQIQGVEFARELHEVARRNIRQYRSSKQRCAEIESINMDAAEYPFPNHPLVISMYNPFGPPVLRKVMDNLNASAAAYPREILLLLFYPECAEIVDAEPQFRLH